MLNDLMLKYGSDKAPHGFCEFYESFFAPVRKEVKSVLEIGIADGASMRGWLDYFPNAKVYGLDAPYDALGRYGDSAHWPLDTGRFLAFIGDQADRDDLARLVEHGPWDIIIDDGGHTMEQQQVSLGVLFPHTTRFYVVEDLHTSFIDKIALYEKGKPVRSYPTGATRPDGKPDQPVTTRVIDALKRRALYDDWLDGFPYDRYLVAPDTPESTVHETLIVLGEWTKAVHIFDRDSDHKHMTAVLEVK